MRLSHRARADVARYLVNYIRRADVYAEAGPGCRNCQTFAADFFGFLVGRGDVVPYHPTTRPFYKPRPYLFLYDAADDADACIVSDVSDVPPLPVPAVPS